ncbi:MFS transporter [Micromonospora lupini]|uniref:Major facilitator superfamily MFS_1 transporter n=1 Tax=Micromonospora lupini str. Lupac 08 TaxID=1150864 RepID=I0L0U4_9ACTN|nr:MFS transporter [Micromonospora lupini]CCH17441.1 Major facilitator superfamily MFS_1 transporter [Micromonospora lupini str. Lupac 08]
MTSVPTTPAPRAGRREWIGFAVLMLPLLLVSMDVSVLYFAVPFISEELRPSATQQLWIFDIYGFVLAGLLITMGALGDRIGRRRLLLLGATAFGAASLLAAYADSAATLIAARAVLGVGGATLMPSTLALVRNMFHDAKQRGTAIGIWTATLTGGIAIGPVLSGVLLEHFWWGSIFLINIPAMLLLLLLAPVLVPEFRNPVRGRFDLLSAALSLGALLPVIYGIKEMARDGVSPARVLAVVAGLLVGALFLYRQRTRAYPMVDLALFRRHGFAGSLAVNLLAMFALVGFAIFTTQHLQLVLGLSPLRAALWSLVPSLAVGGVAPAAAALAQRVEPGVPDRRRLRDRRARLRGADPGHARDAALAAAARRQRVRGRSGDGDVARHRAGPRCGAAGAGRCRLRADRVEQRAGRRPGDGHPGQRGRRDLPPRGPRRAAGRAAGPGPRGGRGDAGRRSGRDPGTAGGGG